jgi:hypothetical protein
MAETPMCRRQMFKVATIEPAVQYRSLSVLLRATPHVSVIVFLTI